MLTRRFAGASLLGGAAAALVQTPAFCADIWANPPSEWTEKDIQRMFSDSPWARKVEVAFGGGGPGGGGGGGGFGGPGGGGADTGAMGEGGGGGMPGGGGGGGGGGRRGGGGRGGAGGGGGAMPTMMFTIRWMSAIPLKQATIRARLGKEADSSAEAKQFLDRQEPHYAIALIGPARPMSAQPGRGAPAKEGEAPLTPEQRAQRMVERLKEVTSLNRKSKEPIRPEVVQAAQQSQNSFLFLFPKSDAITLDDKDVEFATRIGPLEVKRKFKLKDMVYQGQLSL